MTKLQMVVATSLSANGTGSSMVTTEVSLTKRMLLQERKWEKRSFNAQSSNVSFRSCVKVETVCAILQTVLAWYHKLQKRVESYRSKVGECSSEYKMDDETGTSTDSQVWTSQIKRVVSSKVSLLEPLMIQSLLECFRRANSLRNE